MGDAKYKNRTDESVPNADFNQLLTYVIALDLLDGLTCPANSVPRTDMRGAILDGLHLRAADRIDTVPISYRLLRPRFMLLVREGS